MSEKKLTGREEIFAQIDQLKLQLERAKLKHRDASFKHTRESKVLKRVVANLSEACLGYNDDLDKAVLSLKSEFEKRQDVSKLIPRLAILERMLKQNSYAMEKKKVHLDERVKHSGETLQRIPGLPAQLKRDLRNLLSFPSIKNHNQLDQATRLLAIYERAIKIITSNSSHTLQNDPALNKELLAKLSEELQHLISELDFDGESGDLLSDIRIKLLVGVDSDALLELTLQILKLVIQGTHYERKTSEQFLSQVNSSLDKSIKSSVKNLEQSESYAKHRQQMTSELVDITQETETALENAEDLDTAKSAIKPLLEQINMLTERLKHNEQREMAILERVSHNNNQLVGLHQVTQDHRRRLEEQSHRMLIDPLTKVFNRAAFLERLELEYHRWIRNQHNLRILLLDIDNFKALNDSFGYAAGDKALKIIARTISKQIREEDILARFSGEEFILLLPNLADKECQNLLQNLQLQISKLPFKFKDQNITVTASIALSQLKDSDTPEEVLDRLNLALNEAKRRGNNQIAIK